MPHNGRDIFVRSSSNELDWVDWTRELNPDCITELTRLAETYIGEAWVPSVISGLNNAARQIIDNYEQRNPPTVDYIITTETSDHVASTYYPVYRLGSSEPAQYIGTATGTLTSGYVRAVEPGNGYVPFSVSPATPEDLELFAQDVERAKKNYEDYQGILQKISSIIEEEKQGYQEAVERAQAAIPGLECNNPPFTSLVSRLQEVLDQHYHPVPKEDPIRDRFLGVLEEISKKK